MQKSKPYAATFQMIKTCKVVLSTPAIKYAITLSFIKIRGANRELLITPREIIGSATLQKMVDVS